MRQIYLVAIKTLNVDLNEVSDTSSTYDEEDDVLFELNDTFYNIKMRCKIL